MNYSLDNLPNAGANPVVWMDITLNEEVIGRIFIRLYRDVFPAGVENFYRIASNQTYRIQEKGAGRYRYKKDTLRTFQGNKFFHMKYDNYIVSGDIYHNDGTGAGTIYCDKPIPACFGPCYYPHESKGLVSLVPFTDAENGQTFYDSTFMITLDNARPSNILSELDADQIVIGQIYDGLDIIDRINNLIRPFAGRRYPNFKIGCTDVYRNATSGRRIRPMTFIERKKLVNQDCCHKCPDKCPDKCPKSCCYEDRCPKPFQESCHTPCDQCNQKSCNCEKSECYGNPEIVHCDS